MYVAVYVADAFAEIVCVCAPPSDQLENTYVVPFRTCGDGALSVLVEPSTRVAENGVVPLVPFTRSDSPEGTVAIGAVTVLGWRSRDLGVGDPRASRSRST